MADQRPLTHQQVEQFLAAYRDLSSQEKTAVAEHLATCQDCAKLAEDNQQIDAVLKQAAWKQPDPRLADNFYHIIETDGRSWFQTLSRLSGQLAGIAVLLLVVLSAWLVLRNGPIQTPVEEPTVTANQITVSTAIPDSGMPLTFRYTLTGTVSLFAFSPEGSYLATADNGIIKLWRAESGKLLHAVKEDSVSIESLAFTPNGANLLGRDTNGQFHRWLAYNGTYQRAFNGAQSEPGTPFAVGNTTLALVTAENDLELWPLTGNRPNKTIIIPGSTSIISLAMSPDGQMIAAVLQNGTISVWNQYGDLTGTFTPSQETISGLAISNNGELIATYQGSSFQLRQKNTFRYELPPEPSLASGDIITIRFLSEDQCLMVGYEQGFLQSWNVNTGELVKTFHTDPAIEAAIGLTRNGFLYATLDSQRLLTIWEKTE